MNAERNTVPLRITFNPASVLRVAAICTFVLVCGHFAAIVALRQFSPVEHPGFAALAGKFLMDSEMNVPTLFQSFGLLFCALLLATIAGAVRKAQPRDTLYWGILAVLFFGLSIEEICGFHELVIFPLRERLELHGVFYFSWVIPGLVFVAIVGLFFLRFLWRLPTRTRKLIIVAACVYLGGAIGMEMIGGVLAEQTQFQGSFADQSQASAAYLMLATLEELLEISGITLFAFSLLDWMEVAGLSFSLSFVRERVTVRETSGGQVATPDQNAIPTRNKPIS